MEAAAHHGTRPLDVALPGTTKTIPALLCCGLRTEWPSKNSASEEWEFKILPPTFIRQPDPPFCLFENAALFKANKLRKCNVGRL